MSGTVPTASSLAEIYADADLPSQSARWAALLDKFRDLYGRPAEFVSRSPGRVNIIGEHIDYSLYSVLPMAITADVLLAVAVDGPSASSGSDSKHKTFKIRIANVQSRFPTREFDVPVDGDVDIDASVHEWSNYFKSGLRGALKLLRKRRKGGQGEEGEFVPASMTMLMDGTVPVGGGLSSSAAFVTASALAVMVANGVDAVDKRELTELAIVSERAVGVNSGG
jgi:galactokinase